MKVLISALLVTFSFLVWLETPKVKPADLQQLTGDQWIGSLTYLDYRTKKKVSIPTNLTVVRSTADKLSWIFEYQYPDEPKANSKDTVTISEDGKTIDGETVVGRTRPAKGTLMIVTEKDGRDNDQAARFRHTYLIGARMFSIKKEVRYEGTTEFFERNEYTWKR